MRRRNRFASCLLILALLAVTLAPLGCVRGPEVVASSPSGGAVQRPVDTPIRISFDRPMNVQSVAGALRIEPAIPPGAATEVSADGKTFTIRPALPLLPATTYRVTLATSAASTDGKALRKEWSISFATAAPRDEICFRPAYSPDGTWIAWTEGKADAHSWSAFVAPATEGPAANPLPQSVASDVWPRSEAVWSPDGRYLLLNLLAADEGPIRPALALVPVPGAAGAGGGPGPAGPTMLPLNSQLASPSHLVAQYSPDGALLAVQNDMYMADAHSDVERELGVAAADGTGWRKVGNLLLGWSLDGTELFYLDMPGPGEAHNFAYDLYRFNIASGTRAVVGSVGKIRNFGRASQSPGTGAFAFNDWRAEEIVYPEGIGIERLPRDLWLLDVGLRSLTRLTTDAGRNADPAFTADGVLLFASDRAAATGWDVWALASASPASPATNLTARPGYDGQPRPSASGGRIVFISDASGTLEVWEMASDGTEWRQVSGR